MVPTAAMLSPAEAAPVGQGFNLNDSDLRFILQQIRISERHAATATPGNPCGTLTGPGANQIPDGIQGEELPWGLRTVDGTCNNLIPGQEKFGAADQKFPRRVAAEFMDGENATMDVDGPGPGQAGDPTTYATPGNVFDSRPRTISNLIVDQTNHNPAAVAAAGADPNAPKSNESLFIPNVATDVGLSAPFNSMFTLFGQFFDHGLDLVTKRGSSVFMPLKDDDPLVLGPDGAPNTGDDLPPSRRFMVLSRSVTAADQNGVNLTTPFVDQNQTYTSHPSHQALLREYSLNAEGKPVATGRLIEGAAGGMGTWADVKTQARNVLGIELDDQDVLDVPLLATDQYGNFIPGADGFPQIVTPGGKQSGTPQAPVDATAAMSTGHAFLDDIAHHAVPFGDPSGRGGPGSPLTPDTNPGTSDDRNPATYDDEMLAAHFVAGDGRVNENIGLTTVHHVFHSEHNRLVGEIDNMITTGAAADRAAWHDTSNLGAWNYQERLFQAAKFVTEMEYQHLVFEEFGRKVQPMINLFGEGGSGYDTSVNPAIKAEFAHAVYRFGHSMLTETVARRNADGTTNNIGLIEAFLNPQAFTDGGPAGQLTADEAAGSVFRGMSRQVGNEIDEFVTGALRSNLLGLPLDLAAINMGRAREAGVPSLNAARRDFFAESGNSALKPYSSWSDFGFSLKHRESLVNFVAAYGTHPSVRNATTMAGKRAAAELLVNVDPSVPDAGAFMNSTPGSAWANGAGGVTTTGVDDIDLWVGGLAEKRMVFGGMLGSTFNYVFEMQMEDLQFGDRFYYLSRTAGLNLLTQLEGNSFAELVMRNTDAEGLPADVFSRPDYVFNMGRLGPVTGPIQDDPSTEDYNEGDTTTEPGSDLHRLADGTLRYTGPAHTVFNGTAGEDRAWGSEGDDTFRGNDGNDWVQGGDGVDNLIGGLGDDILEDIFGDDTLKGGDGDDALSSGQGFGGDLNQGGRGRDFIVGGNDMTETFAGPGNDFVFAGDGEDTVFGDDGDDWIEGGKGPFNLLQGDNGAPFQNDPNQPGNDVLDGDGGEQDFDSEGGDDIMLMGPGIQRAEGMAGFDWATHKGDPQAADSDMNFTGLLPPALEALRDRFDLVEGLSGWKNDDVLVGDDGIPDALAGIEDPADHRLNQAGINRITGLAALLPNGATSWGGGNIILGGGGSDTMEGRGGDDIINGDAWLNVQLRVPDLSTPATGDFTLVDSMTAQLRQNVLDGRIDPGTISIVRTIETAPAGADEDTVVYSDSRFNYDITNHGNGNYTVTHVVTPTVPDDTPGDDEPVVSDGTDTLMGVENLVFADTVAPGIPAIGEAVGGNGSATVSWTRPATGAVTEYLVTVTNNAGNAVEAQARSAGTATSLRVTGLANGETYRFKVQARNNAGISGFSGLSNAVTPAPTVPAPPVMGNPRAGNGQVTVNWTAPADDGGSLITGYQVEVLNAAGNLVGGAPRPAGGAARELTVTGLVNGRTYWFRVRAVNDSGPSAPSNELSATPSDVPGAPRIGTASALDSAAIVRWLAPANPGALGINDYRIRVVNAAGNQVGALRVANAAATQARVGQLVNGREYRFQVAAVSEIGQSAFSQLSNPVRPGTVPGRPVIRDAQAGQPGGILTATARWSAPRTVSVPRLTGYTVTAMRMQSRAPNATVLRRFRSPVLLPGRTERRFVLPDGIYRFEVVAWNSIGRSQPSQRSQPVRAR